jgi:hypothetical protein
MVEFPIMQEEEWICTRSVNLLFSQFWAQPRRSIEDPPVLYVGTRRRSDQSRDRVTNRLTDEMRSAYDPAKSDDEGQGQGRKRRM